MDEKTNVEATVAVVIHLFHLDLLDEFSRYVQQVREVFTETHVIVTVSDKSDEENFKRIEAAITNSVPRALILQVENRGVDIGAFLSAYQLIRDQGLCADFILKIHSKTSCEKWRKKLILPLVDPSNLKLLKDIFDSKNRNRIGYAASRQFILRRSFDDEHHPYNFAGLEEVYRKFKFIRRKWTSFVGGTMFWINRKVLDDNLTPEVLSFAQSRFCVGKPPPNLQKGVYMEYIFERLFTGNFCSTLQNIQLD
jgi:lipopolysaccharide biosynthesis protein